MLTEIIEKEILPQRQDFFLDDFSKDTKMTGKRNFKVSVYWTIVDDQLS